MMEARNRVIVLKLVLKEGVMPFLAGTLIV
jgi:hypothetical protein